MTNDDLIRLIEDSAGVSALFCESEVRFAFDLLREYLSPAARPQVVVIASDDGDWEALYLNGRKVREDHSLNWRFILEALGIPYSNSYVPVDPYDTDASFPETLPSPP